MTCIRKVVTATIIATGGLRYVGTNACRRPQTVCPRADYPSGEGYEICFSVCDQIGHAEAVAIGLAGDSARGSTLYLENKGSPCARCQAKIEKAGVALVVIGKPPEAP